MPVLPSVQMHRLTSALLLGAAVLVTTWVSAPAAPTAPPPHVSEAELATIDAMAPAAAALDQEVARLRAQLAVAPAPPEPRRDPFRFGAPRPASRASGLELENPEVLTTDAVAPEPALLWPSLAAVMTDPSGPTAVIAWGDDIEFVTPGETFRDFRVVSVSGSAIELLHIQTNTTKTLTLR
jgi:hypothetical protein